MPADDQQKPAKFSDAEAAYLAEEKKYYQW